MSEHASWCNVTNAAGPCDCGGTGGRCPVCGAEGPCGLTADGVPLICSLADDPLLTPDPVRCRHGLDQWCPYCAEAAGTGRDGCLPGLLLLTAGALLLVLAAGSAAAAFLWGIK